MANQDQDAPRLQAGSGTLPEGIKADTLSELVVAVLQSEDLADLLEVSLVEDAASARQVVDSQQAQVAVIIPAGFSQQFADINSQATVEFYQDPTLRIGPAIMRSILHRFTDGMASVKIVVDVFIDEATPDYALAGQVVQEFLDVSLVQSDHLAADVLAVRLPASDKRSEEEQC